MNTKHITKEQACEAMSAGEFGPGVINSNHKVVVIMTQDWCREWNAMKRWIDSLEEPGNLVIYELIYNRVDYFDNFLKLKETTWNNELIPYVRYYSQGLLIHTSNYVTKEDFFRLLQQ